MIAQTKEGWISNAAQCEMLLCHVHLCSRLTLDAISTDEPFGFGLVLVGGGGGVGKHTQRGFVDYHLRRRVGEGDANKQGVLKILEDASVARARPGSNKLMRRPRYECVITRWISGAETNTAEQTGFCLA